ncbi:MAG TPA: DUF58 domain-containing protein, partial [Bacteroidia bacterium]|nr:DUF58 domain-containing protein [Bacteroidia bacterium]
MKIRWNIFLGNRFFYLLSGVVATFAVCFAFPRLLPFAQTAIVIILALTLTDVLLLFTARKAIHAQRILPRIFSLGSENPVRIEIRNNTALPFSLAVTDEIPVQFQKRDFSLKLTLGGRDKKTLHYTLRPLSRGEYVFEDINIYMRSILQLAERRILIRSKQTVP